MKEDRFETELQTELPSVHIHVSRLVIGINYTLQKSFTLLRARGVIKV